MTNRLLRIPQVASVLDLPIARTYELARIGALPVVRLGRQIRVHPGVLDEWLRSGGRLMEDTGRVSRSGPATNSDREDLDR